MEKINGIFSYEFNSSDKEGNYSLIYIYQNKPQNIKQYIYFIKDFKEGSGIFLKINPKLLIAELIFNQQYQHNYEHCLYYC